MTPDTGWVGPEQSERRAASPHQGTLASPREEPGRVGEVPAGLLQPESCHHPVAEPFIPLFDSLPFGLRDRPHGDA